ncbi:MAG: restriction endonuclease subunit S [Flavobacterium sp.]
MEKVKLRDICSMQSGGTPSRTKSEFFSGNIPWAKISDLEKSNDGYIYKTEEHITKEALKSINNRFFKEGTLLLAMYGSVGKTAIAKIDLSTNQAILGINIIDKKNVDIKYLRYWFTTIKEQLLNRAVGAALANISLGIVKELEIPHPPLSTQQKIAAILDQADALIQNNRAIVQKYDALTQSLFLDMFGDPVKNEKGWEKTELGKLGDFKNGLNYSKSDYGFTLKVIGVGDFKNFSRLDDFSNTSIIAMNEAPRDEFLLKDGDLLFVRSNGNKELVGRCLIVYVGDEKVSYSGFCIRLRLNSNQINSNYLVQLLQRAEFKKHIFKNGRGANIQNINQELLGNIKIQIPPITLQNLFAERVVVIEAQKQQAQLALAKSEELFQSLLQRAFKGELS